LNESNSMKSVVAKVQQEEITVTQSLLR
jgi:hypothetical protein